MSTEMLHFLPNRRTFSRETNQRYVDLPQLGVTLAVLMYSGINASAIVTPIAKAAITIHNAANGAIGNL